ncbi:hypothetical protein STEG23_010478, partial [Scotinomys teguina]
PHNHRPRTLQVPWILGPLSPKGNRPLQLQESINKDTTKTANLTKKKATQKRQRSRSSSMAQRSTVGCRIFHEWKDGNELITEWRGTVLYLVPVNPSLYLVKYDGIDCVYALELPKDERIVSLKVLSDTVEQFQDPDPRFADTITGKRVKHLFESEHGSKNEWRGMVLAQEPILDVWFYITHEKDPILYIYQLLDDYKEGDLHIHTELNEAPPLEVDMELVDGLIGTRVQYTKDDGSKRGTEIDCLCTVTGVLNVKANFVQNEVPVFNTYEEYHKSVLRSFENISIILNVEGKIVFVSKNVLPLLGHRPEDIMGKTLLNILLDEEKEEISQKVNLQHPLAKSVGNLIEFYCHVRKGNAGRNIQHTYDYGNMCEGRDIYEYVKFILYLQDSYDESFLFFGNCGSNGSIRLSPSRLLWDQKYYLVGTISVLHTKAESEHPVEFKPDVIVIESDDDSSMQHHRPFHPRLVSS